MPIQSVSPPPDLKLWDPDKEGAKPFYFELFGETEPLLDGSFAELATAATIGGAPTAPRVPVYEYWWTIGHEGRPPRASGSRLTWSWSTGAYEIPTIAPSGDCSLVTVWPHGSSRGGCSSS